MHTFWCGGKKISYQGDGGYYIEIDLREIGYRDGK
jgi:hypothetical protein